MQKRKSLIIKGLNGDPNPLEAVKNLCTDVLKIGLVQIASVRTLFEHKDKIAVAVEFQAEESVKKIFDNIKNLADTDISIEKDLNADRMADKRALLKLKKDIRVADPKIHVFVRNDRIKIEDQWMQWSKEKVLVCGDRDGKETLKAIIGEKIDSINLSYYDILNALKTKKSKNLAQQKSLAVV